LIYKSNYSDTKYDAAKETHSKNIGPVKNIPHKMWDLISLENLYWKKSAIRR
jgi:hypothetical protein